MSNSDAGGVPENGPENGRTARVAFIALLSGAIGIAFAPIFVRLSELGPSATAFHRLLLAAPFLWLWMGLDRRRAAGTGRKPASARDFGWLVLGQRFTPVFLAGMAVALLGAVLLMGSSVTLGLDHLLGDGLGLATAVFYAGYMLAVKKVRADFSTATVMAWSAAAGAIALLPLALVSGESIIATTATGWGVLLALALLSHVGGQSLIAYALAHLPAAFSSVSLLLQPVAAALLAWLILSEALGLLQGLGGAVVLAGIAIARRGSG